MKTNQEKHNIFSDPVEILSGTMLCNKYSVIKRMDAKSNNVELFLCEFENKKYVAKIFRNGVAIKEEVSKLKMVNSPFLIKICDVDKFGDSLIVVFPYYKNGSLKGHTFSLLHFTLGHISKANLISAIIGNNHKSLISM